MARKQQHANTGTADNPGGAGRAGDPDHLQARREQNATQELLSLGAKNLGGRPWRPASVPASAVDLAHFALWRSNDSDPEVLFSALALLRAARAEVDGLESGLLFAARSAGLTWAQIAEAAGFNSPQACQQHYHRLTAKHETES